MAGGKSSKNWHFHFLVKTTGKNKNDYFGGTFSRNMRPFMIHSPFSIQKNEKDRFSFPMITNQVENITFLLYGKLWFSFFPWKGVGKCQDNTANENGSLSITWILHLSPTKTSAWFESFTQIYYRKKMDMKHKGNRYNFDHNSFLW